VLSCESDEQEFEKSAMVGLAKCLAEVAAGLSDEELRCELECAERCALLSTRTGREVALLRVRCVKRELARRAVGVSRPTSLEHGGSASAGPL
jgi:hypothetical protein